MIEERDLKEDVKIDRSDMVKEYSEHPSIFSYWASRLEIAKFEYDQMKLKADLIYNQLYLRIKEELLRENTKVTENHLKALVETDKEYVEVKKELLEKKNEVGVLNAAVESMKTKSVMLSNLKAIDRSAIMSELLGNKIE